MTVIAASATELKRRLFTIEQYHQMIASGVLTEGDRVELIDGEILEMAAIGSKHGAQVKRLNRLFSGLLEPSVLISVQDPVELGPRSEPEPDVALLRWRDDFYETSHPQASDVYLVIEVADSTLDYDRSVKAPLYSRSDIFEYWIVNLQDNVIEVYRQPSPSGYQIIQSYQRGMDIEVMALPGLGLTVDRILD
jgi:Uma2 family endonuclease